MRNPFSGKDKIPSMEEVYKQVDKSIAEDQRRWRREEIEALGYAPMSQFWKTFWITFIIGTFVGITAMYFLGIL